MEEHKERGHHTVQDEGGDRRGAVGGWTSGHGGTTWASGFELG